MDVEGESCLYTNLCTLVDKQAWFEVDPKLHNVRVGLTGSTFDHVIAAN